MSDPALFDRDAKGDFIVSLLRGWETTTDPGPNVILRLDYESSRFPEDGGPLTRLQLRIDEGPARRMARDLLTHADIAEDARRAANGLPPRDRRPAPPSPAPVSAAARLLASARRWWSQAR